MTMKLLGLFMLSVVSTLLYGFGDALQFTGAGNLDTIFIPLIGKLGYYLFEASMPFVSIFSTFLAIREAAKH